MKNSNQPIAIVMADDDSDDRMLALEALEEVRLTNALHFVEDGAQLMDFLLHQGDYTDPKSAPRPGLILLDLNMPKMDGREALLAIKSNPELRQIPVVVMTTSRAEEDIFASYDSGANSFISKPVTFEGLVAAMKCLSQYWLEIVELPAGGAASV